MSGGNMGSFLESMRAVAIPEQEPVQTMDPLAQALELRDRWSSVYGDHADFGRLNGLRCGDLAVPKRGLNIYRDATVLIVWRWLDMADPQDHAIVMDYIDKAHVGERLDCMVGMLKDNGRLTFIVPASTSLLTPYAEKLPE